jgi:two-component system nitrate/nitrite response regulator NarL
MPSTVCVIVHPSRIIREGLTQILANSPFEPACTAPRISDVSSKIAGAGEQVLLLIGVREGCNLAEDLGAAKTSFPDAHIVVVGDAGKRDLVIAALTLGATSFVDENVTPSNLIKELELAAQGEPVISVLVLKWLLAQVSAPPSEPEPAAAAVVREEPQQAVSNGLTEQKLQLSGREARILSSLVQGASNKMIAYQLQITEATVKVHVKAILRKIRVKNRTQAAIWALKCQDSPNKLSAEDAPESSENRNAWPKTERRPPAKGARGTPISTHE